jgi:hypothetical protein
MVGFMDLKKPSPRLKEDGFKLITKLKEGKG